MPQLAPAAVIIRPKKRSKVTADELRANYAKKGLKGVLALLAAAGLLVGCATVQPQRSAADRCADVTAGPDDYRRCLDEARGIDRGVASERAENAARWSTAMQAIGRNQMEAARLQVEAARQQQTPPATSYDCRPDPLGGYHCEAR